MSSEKMCTGIEIRSLQNLKVNKRFLKKVVCRTLDQEKVQEDKELSIALVDNGMIKELNRKFRGMSEVTDVLAFPLGGEFASTESLLGEIVISVEEAREAAKEGRHELREELALLVIHGILHLLGYTDEEKKGQEIMREKEGKVLESLSIKIKTAKETINETAS